SLLTALVPASLRLLPWLVAPRGARPPLSMLLADPSARLLAGGAAAVLLVLVLRRRPAAVAAATCIVMIGGAVALTRPPRSRALDVALSGRPMAERLVAQCSSGLPRACGTVPLYTWRLNRGLLYGAEYYLAAQVAEWPETAPPASALVLMDRNALNAFIARYGGSRRLARLGRFDPAGGAAPWLVVRIGPMN
ncbi:MAG: hypothetical protein ACRD1L_12420, partial [Terriglobales bacterium]